MSKRNPIERSQYINSQYKEYLRSSFEFKTPKLQKLFEQQLEVEDLFKGPYVDLNLPFKRGMSLDEMIADGAVCKSFRRLGDMNFERPLYSHQEESIRRICSGRSAIITTGTGSGKTESFLYPILNELMSDVEKGNMEVGVRAIFLYPMNALVNDQIDRVRKILTQCPEITYGFFTGETKESVPKNYREKYGAENNTFIPENELVSREEIRKNPPHLLFTHYSMLEYLLIRPNDYSIFTPERLNNWKFVVLDEAHSYYGSLGIELSLLMRRLTGLASNKPRFILTSATLGEQGKSESEIVNFARSLTSASFDIQDIIFSKRILLSSSKLSYTIDAGDYSEIKKAKNDIQTVRTIGNRYKNVDSMDLKSYLYELFVGDRNVFHLYETLKDGSKSFKSILASFSAAFLDSNQVRMLQKRLIWKVIKDNQYRNISVDQLTATLSGMIKEGNLFQNDLSAHKNAWITTLVDLLKVDGSNDAEGLHPDYFRSIDELVFGKALEEFKSYISSHPSDLNTYINEKILPGDVYRDYHNFKWFDEIEGNDEKMEHFVSTIKSIAEEYEKAKKEAVTEENYKEADYYQRQIENLHKEKVIDSLSKYCVIPKYGFPVDVVELQIYKEGILDNSYDLSRDLKIAISEYAPDSEIIVDGKKYTSKYISLPKTGEYPRNYFCTCPNCKKINVSVSTRTGNECKYCGEPLGTVVQEFYIEPVNGFKTGITKESTRSKPKRSYAGEVSYLGGGIKDENVVSLSNAITIETSTNDELLVMNKSSFNMCPVCGYSDMVKGKVITPTSLKKHKNYRQFDCSCEELTQIKLGHRFQTDVARFTIPMLGSFTKEDYAIALSFMYAFLEGISIGLGIERNDIEGVLELNLEQHSYDILIYDNVPGGAGHVKRLVEKNAVITSLNAAYAKVSQQCCDENTSCYNCLRNYYNQANHSKLKRKYARDFIESLLRQIGVRP